MPGAFSAKTRIEHAVVLCFGSLSFGCGARTSLDDGYAASARSGASAGSDKPAMGDASTSVEGGVAACSPQPATGVAIASIGDIHDNHALGVADSTLYIGTIDTSASPVSGAISEIPLGGGARRTLVAPEYVLGGFAFDGSRIYYPRTGTSTNDAGVTLQSTIGLVSEDLTTQAASDLPNPLVPGQFAATSARPGVFWLGGHPMGLTTTLYFWDPQSNVNSPLATGEYLVGVAVDGTGVYWADTGGQQDTIYTAPLDGGPPTLLATAPWTVARGGLLGLSSKDVVFVREFATGSIGVSIEAVARTGGPVRQVLTTDVLFAWVDDDHVYWSEQAHQGRLQRMPIAGGNAEIVWDQPAPGQVVSVAFDACNIYIGLINVGQVYAREK
jgi:hypothetical protein